MRRLVEIIGGYSWQWGLSYPRWFPGTDGQPSALTFRGGIVMILVGWLLCYRRPQKNLIVRRGGKVQNLEAKLKLPT